MDRRRSSPIVRAKPELHGYQVQAVEFLRRTPRGLLALDMGLGKTASVLSALEPRHLPALVVAPPKVARMTWPTELKLWRPDLSFAEATAGGAERALALKEGADVTIVTKHAMPEAIPRRKADTRWKTIILDESSMYKNSGSVGFRRAKTLTDPKKGSENVWLMTGTPSPNGLMDLYGQFKLLDGGKRLGKTLSEFRSRHFYPGKRLPTGTVIEWILHDGMEEKIYSKVEDISIGMQAKYYLDLPPVKENEIYFELPPKARKVYRDMKRDLVIDMRDILGDIPEEMYILAASAGVAHGKLSQIAAGFVFDEDREVHVLHKEKSDVMTSIMNEAMGNPILGFYQFVWEKEYLLSMPGAVHISSKEFTMEKWEAGEIPLLVAHPASASHGLNLQYGCHTIVWVSPTWELELWLQGNGRVARQGQTKPVVIHQILADGTVNVIAINRLATKEEIQQQLKDHIESPI